MWLVTIADWLPDYSSGEELLPRTKIRKTNITVLILHEEIIMSDFVLCEVVPKRPRVSIRYPPTPGSETAKPPLLSTDLSVKKSLGTCQACSGV